MYCTWHGHYFLNQCRKLPLQTWINFTRRCFIPYIVEIGQLVAFISSMYKAWSFIWINLNTLQSKDTFSRFGSIGPSGSRVEENGHLFSCITDRKLTSGSFFYKIVQCFYSNWVIFLRCTMTPGHYTCITGVIIRIYTG